MTSSIDFWKLAKMVWSTCWHHFFKCALIKNIISKHIKKTTQWFCVNLIKTIMMLWNMTFNCFIKHNEQNSWINNQQKIVVFDETSWLTIFCTNENSIEQINKNHTKNFHWTNTHNVKNWNKQNHVLEHKRRKNFFNNKSYEIDL